MKKGDFIIYDPIGTLRNIVKEAEKSEKEDDEK